MTAFAIYSVTHIIPSSFIKIIEKLGKYLIPKLSGFRFSTENRPGEWPLKT
jgi:hypothetical protein